MPSVSPLRVKEVPTSRELFKTYFITIRYLRTEASCGKKYTREKELEFFKNNIRERFYFICNVAGDVRCAQRADLKYSSCWDIAGENTRRNCTLTWIVHFRPVEAKENPS